MCQVKQSLEHVRIGRLSDFQGPEVFGLADVPRRCVHVRAGDFEAVDRYSVEVT